MHPWTGSEILETTFPMDVTEEDPSSRPWSFRPTAYLVVIIADIEEARASGDGARAGRIRAQGHQALHGHADPREPKASIGRWSIPTRFVATVAEDVEGRELYLAYAREDRCAMWVRLPDEGVVAKALRVLADFDWLHLRYYGNDEQHDFHSRLTIRDQSHRHPPVARRPGFEP